MYHSFNVQRSSFKILAQKYISSVFKLKIYRLFRMHSLINNYNLKDLKDLKNQEFLTFQGSQH